MKIASTVKLSDESLELIKRELNESVYSGSMFKPEDADLYRDAEILICRDKEINVELLSEMNRLQWIFSACDGVDRLPFDELISRGIRVANAPNISNDAMSDYVIGSMFLFTARFADQIKNQTRKYWEPYVFTETLSDKTLLILGAGRIGCAIAKKARAFDMTVLGTCNTKKSLDNFDYVGGQDEMIDLCKKADFVVSTLPLTDATRRIVDKTVLEAIGENGVFINISRGGILNTDDLVECLQNKTLKGAVIDVFEKEPLSSDSPLWDIDNLVITTHSSGRIKNFLDKTIPMFVDCYKSYAVDKSLINEIDLRKQY